MHPSDEPSASPSGTATAPHVSLQIVRGQAREKVRVVNTPAFLIGSANDCDLVLGDPQFSQVYAYLLVQAGSVSVRHLGFAPELTVNGRSVTRAVLHDGDRLRLGPYELVVCIQERRASPGHGHSLFGHLPVGARANIMHQSEADALSAVAQLVGEVRQAVGVAPSAIPLSAATTIRPAAAGPGLAAS